VKTGVTVQTQLAKGLPLIQGDRVQLQQVILNLIVNAVEAMNGAAEGARKLLISTSKPEANGVLVAVGDSGPGLAQTASTALSTLSTQPKPADWVWVYRSAVRLSKLMADAYGRRQTCRKARSFNSQCPHIRTGRRDMARACRHIRPPIAGIGQ
jgi:hypothetical protein